MSTEPCFPHPWSSGLQERARSEELVPRMLSQFCLFGCYGARAQKSRDTNDRSGGSRVLVEGIVMISTVGVAMVQEETDVDKSLKP